MSSRRIAIAVLAALLLSGCASHYEKGRPGERLDVIAPNGSACGVRAEKYLVRDTSIVPFPVDVVEWDTTRMVPDSVEAGR
jgi:hypothetical protein